MTSRSESTPFAPDPEATPDPSARARSGVVFNLQRFGVEDGPGIRTTVFLKGCPLRCSWCHNPEGIAPAPVLMLRASRCLACGACAAVCPGGLAGPLAGPPPARPGAPAGAARPGAGARRPRPGAVCLRCGACAEACPAGAREVVGRVLTVEEVLARVERDRPFYEATGGGVTFSGGEPAAGGNAPFLLACLEACGELGLHRAVDTCGHVAPAVLAEVARHCELLLYDLKLADPARHRLATGADPALIRANLRALSAAGHAIAVRVPLVPGLNDDDGNLAATGRLVASLAGSHPVHLLPYHALGRDKARRLAAPDGAPPDPGEPDGPRPAAIPDLERAAAILRRHGLEVRIGGSG